MPRIHRKLSTSLLASALISITSFVSFVSIVSFVSVIGFSTNAEAALVVITPTDDDRGLDSFLDGNFDCCQLDDGLATVDLAMAPVFIQTLLAADEDFAGFMLRNVTVPSGVFTIWTTDSGFEDLFPTLAIDYEMVPEPGSLLLVGTALIFLARRARRAVEVR
jgi:hypothetical protein